MKNRIDQKNWEIKEMTNKSLDLLIKEIQSKTAQRYHSS